MLTLNTRLVLTFALTACFTTDDAAGLSYFIEWNFDAPLVQEIQSTHGGEELTYNPTTGELGYRVSDGRWWNPPDLLSASGAFLETRSLNAVPLHPVTENYGLPIEILEQLRWPGPRWTSDEKVAEETLLGSEAIRIHYDAIGKFWPYPQGSPEVLEQYGLDAMPTEFVYGAVLPTGFSREFLLDDLYTSRPVRLAIIPEPASLACLVCGILVTAARYRGVSRALPRRSPRSTPA